jgi:ribosomal protein S18 acetylase RimI-like enzyme
LSEPDPVPIEFRQAVPGDYDAVIAVLDDWWAGRRMAPMLPRLFFEHGGPWTTIAHQDRELLGFLVAFKSQTKPSQAYCHFIGVHPQWRGQGIGEALYQRLFADATADGCSEVLAVTSPLNRASLAFHQRLGFALLPGESEVDGIPFLPNYDGPGEDRVRLRKPLFVPSARARTAND